VPSIKLRWAPVPEANSYVVSRKLPNSSSWTVLASYGSSVNEHTDLTIKVNLKYEYKVEARTQTYKAFGYAMTGIDVDLQTSTGTVILVIDSEVYDSIKPEILTLKQDLRNEGWDVIDKIYARSHDVKAIKSDIKNIYKSSNVKPVSVFLIGHIPVPYSGNLAPDGHTPDHMGAWPCDGFYGETEEYWSDNSVTNTAASGTRNDNIPGDGKFDQSTFLGSLEMSVGRVDFYDIPAFNLSEVNLLRNYFAKNHAFRTAKFKPQNKAVIDDNFGYFNGEAFGANGWRNFSTLVGKDSIIVGDYFTELESKSYLWSYACGGGNYTGAGGVGSTQDFVTNSPKGVFTMLFGSYFGDWDTKNNFMRAALASGNILTCTWAGRPQWYFHHMALGETIGYSAQQTMSNSFTYDVTYGARFVHTALLGDPTLKMNYRKNPIQTLKAEQVGSHVVLNWENVDSVHTEYIILKKWKDDNAWSILGTSMQHTFIDSCIHQDGQVKYKVAIVDSVFSRTATYTEALGISTDYFEVQKSTNPKLSLSYVYEDNKVAITNQGKSNETITWDFGDGTTLNSKSDTTITYVYQDTGRYNLIVTLNNGCFSDIDTIELNILTKVNELFNLIEIIPNPAYDYVEIKIPMVPAQVSIIDVEGRTRYNFLTKNDTARIPVIDLFPGTYWIVFLSSDSKQRIKRSFVKY
jgi:hypothetical protein